jgi:predicted RND superfamily exporter protein
LLATVALLLVTFRTGARALPLTLLALLVGILWMAGTMAALGMKPQLPQLRRLPHHLRQRRRLRRQHSCGASSTRSEQGDWASGGDPRSRREGTGGAVILCSLTTIIGYTSLYTSANLALNSFGLAMAISEVTCLAAALVALPALVVTLFARSRPSRPV